MSHFVLQIDQHENVIATRWYSYNVYGNECAPHTGRFNLSGPISWIPWQVILFGKDCRGAKRVPPRLVALVSSKHIILQTSQRIERLCND